MKKMRKLIPALAMLVLSAVMMSTASYAWFSMNTNVVAEGMKIQAQASGSLVIAQENASETFMGSSVTTFSAASNYVNATTYKKLSEDTNAKYQWVKADGSKIDADLGSIKSDATDALTAIGQDDIGEGKIPYYFDFLVYIAANGDEIKNQKLSATVTFTKVENSVAFTGKALSVAFFVLEPEAVGYNANEEGSAATLKTNWEIQQTVATSGTDSKTNAIANYWTATDRKQTVVLSDNITIPSAISGTEKKVIPVVMRVYFDGDASEDVSGDNPNTPDTETSYTRHYVNSKNIDTNAFGLSVSFNIAAAATESTN